MERIYSGSENEPKVAVVLPVYNTEKYLRECIDSLLDQEYKNFIIFAVNDGSTDGSKEILLEYARKDTRLIVLDKRNGGVSSARNLALDKIAELANFDFVCFADSDDIVNRQYISAYVDAACKYSADYIVCGWTHFDKSGVNTSKEKYACIPPMEIPPKDVFDHLYKVDKWKKLCTTSTSCFLANRCFSWKVIGESRFDEQLKTGEDQEFLIRLLINVNKGVALNDINYFYRLRRSSLSHEKNVTFEDVLLFLKILDRIDEFPVCAKKKHRATYTGNVVEVR